MHHIIPTILSCYTRPSVSSRLNTPHDLLSSYPYAHPCSVPLCPGSSCDTSFQCPHHPCFSSVWMERMALALVWPSAELNDGHRHSGQKTQHLVGWIIWAIGCSIFITFFLLSLVCSPLQPLTFFHLLSSFSYHICCFLLPLVLSTQILLRLKFLNPPSFSY